LAVIPNGLSRPKIFQGDGYQIISAGGSRVSPNGRTEVLLGIKGQGVERWPYPNCRAGASDINLLKYALLKQPLDKVLPFGLFCLFRHPCGFFFLLFRVRKVVFLFFFLGNVGGFLLLFSRCGLLGCFWRKDMVSAGLDSPNGQAAENEQCKQGGQTTRFSAVGHSSVPALLRRPAEALQGATHVVQEHGLVILDLSIQKHLVDDGRENMGMGHLQRLKRQPLGHLFS
jgi:hypothetical protein